MTMNVNVNMGKKNRKILYLKNKKGFRNSSKPFSTRGGT